MAAMGWYYNAGDGVYYWTYSRTMSNTDFAESLYGYLRRKVKPSETSEIKRQDDLDAMKQRAYKKCIYVDND